MPGAISCKDQSNRDGLLSLAEDLAGTDAALAAMDTNHDATAIAGVVPQTKQS